ncbi:mitochondrial inner membrane protease subunit 1 isoform X2 [Prorops nasuta]
MEPVLNHNDIIFAERLSVKTHNYEKGDIVILKCPDDPKQLICKRILALPGDKIWHDFVDYIIVPKGHVWLEGDNKDNSTDSRNFGPVPQGLIRSRVLCKLWPPTDFYMIGNIYN